MNEEWPKRKKERIGFVVGPMLNSKRDKFVALYSLDSPAQYSVCTVYGEQFPYLANHHPEVYEIAQRPPIPNKQVPAKKEEERANGLLITLSQPFYINTIQYKQKGTIKVDEEAPAITEEPGESFDADGILATGVAYLAVFAQLVSEASNMMPNLSPDALSEVVRSMLWKMEWRAEKWAKKRVEPRPTGVTAYDVLSAAPENRVRLLGELANLSMEEAGRMVNTLKKDVDFPDMVKAAIVWRYLTEAGFDKEEAWAAARAAATSV